MSRTKFAFFIGGPLDGQRHLVDELRPTSEALHAERATVPAPYGGTDVQLKASRLSYRMASRPVNPLRDLAGSVGHDVIDAEIGVYHYIGSERAK